LALKGYNENIVLIEHLYLLCSGFVPIADNMQTRQQMLPADAITSFREAKVLEIRWLLTRDELNEEEIEQFIQRKVQSKWSGIFPLFILTNQIKKLCGEQNRTGISCNSTNCLGGIYAGRQTMSNNRKQADAIAKIHGEWRSLCHNNVFFPYRQ
jgi:hypothetical protein